MNKIENAVFEGIRKTISRFRRKPFHYFTEADIHSSLLNDIIEADAHTTIWRPKADDKDLSALRHISVSMVHQEYPTNFRYKKEELLHGYKLTDEIHKTSLTYKDSLGKAYGDRGNFDLAVLNLDFIIRMLTNHSLTLALENIINKDNSKAIDRLRESEKAFSEELLYAIEVKFIHPFNARNINMLHEVVKDDRKLILAHTNSEGAIKPINLVFCSSPAKGSSRAPIPVVDLVREYIKKGTAKDRNTNKFNHPEEVVTIFVESFIGEENTKLTSKPIAIGPNNEWVTTFFNFLNIN